MKVLQINAIYEKFSTGRTTKELHLSLLEKGIESFVASPNLNGLKERAFQIGTKADWKRHALLSRIIGTQGYFSVNATKKLLEYIDEIKPDIIHLRNLHSNYINLKLLLKYIAKNNIATVLTLHDSWFYTGKCVYYIEDACDKWKQGCGNCPALKKGNPSIFFDRSKKMLADKSKWFSAIKKLAVVGVSEWTAKDASQSILKNASIIRTVYNWIDLQLFSPLENKEETKKALCDQYNLDYEKKIIFGVAMGWNEQKGIDLFMQLANKGLEDYQIVLVGQNDFENKNENIKFIGTLTDVKVLSQFYGIADVFVNPSVQETFGKTTAEAMACGTPVVALNSSATPELVGTDGTCGILIDKKDVDDFFGAIKTVSDEKNMHNYRINCRKRAEELFLKEKNINQYIDIYRELLKNEG